MVTFNTRQIFNEYYNGEKNFLTPNVYSYGHKRFGYKVLLYEKSSGRGIRNDPLYGLSFLLLNNRTNEVQKIDLCKAFQSTDELDKYLESIGLNEIHEADVYGEVKIIES